MKKEIVYSQFGFTLHQKNIFKKYLTYTAETFAMSFISKVLNLNIFK